MTSSSSPPPRVYCLSVRQPWAWLLVQGLKTVENRSWPTKHRGDLLIHASKTLTGGKRGTQLILDRLEPLFAKQIVGDWPRAGDLDVSAIVGAVELVDVVVDNSGASMWAKPPFGPVDGLRWIVRRPRPTFSPLPLNGTLGLFLLELADLPADLQGQVSASTVPRPAPMAPALQARSP